MLFPLKSGLKSPFKKQHIKYLIHSLLIFNFSNTNDKSGKKLQKCTNSQKFAQLRITQAEGKYNNDQSFLQVSER